MGFDATLLANIPIRPAESNRRKTMLILSKHFRVPPSFWEGKPVTELNEWFRDALELAREEKPQLTTDALEGEA